MAWYLTNIQQAKKQYSECHDDPSRRFGAPPGIYLSLHHQDARCELTRARSLIPYRLSVRNGGCRRNALYLPSARR